MYFAETIASDGSNGGIWYISIDQTGGVGNNTRIATLQNCTGTSWTLSDVGLGGNGS